MILDVGGGSGKIAEFISPVTHNLIVLDRRPDAIRGLPPGVRGVVADMLHLPIRDKSVDVGVSADAVEHVPTELRVPALLEMRRVARRRVVVHCPIQQESDGFFAADYDLRFNASHRRLFGTDEPNIREHIDSGWPTLDQLKKGLPTALTRGTQNARVWYWCLLFGRIPFVGLLVGPIYRIFLLALNDRPPYYTGIIVQSASETP